MCTSFVIKTQSGDPVYGRTMEWGAFDLHSDLVLVPRNLSSTSELGGGKQGMTWRNKFGFVAINAVKKPFVTDGMNEAGLAIGVLYFPGFAEYQPYEMGQDSFSLNNIDLSAYILSQFETIAEIKSALPKLRVVYNEDIAKVFGAPVPLHLIIIDRAGVSIVVEYVNGELKIHDNKIGVLTNAPPYDWHIMNLRNYPMLSEFGASPDREIDGVSLAPFGAGSGMLGLPGDVTPVSRFVRAVAFTQTLIPPRDIEAGINEAARILNNFDIPRGLVREGESSENYHLNFTQWTTIGDLKHKRYYWWTEHNRRMRMIDLTALSFEGDRIISQPLDVIRTEDIEECTDKFISD